MAMHDDFHSETKCFVCLFFIGPDEGRTRADGAPGFYPVLHKKRLLPRNRNWPLHVHIVRHRGKKSAGRGGGLSQKKPCKVSTYQCYQLHHASTHQQHGARTSLNT